MGNCMETCTQWEAAELGLEKHKEGGEVEGGFEEKRVKVVLTKEELEWLIRELSESNGKRSLEGLVGELERKRRECVVEERWRPCLESIMEGPESPEMVHC